MVNKKSRLHTVDGSEIEVLITEEHLMGIYFKVAQDKRGVRAEYTTKARAEYTVRKAFNAASLYFMPWTHIKCVEIMEPEMTEEFVPMSGAV